MSGLNYAKWDNIDSGSDSEPDGYTIPQPKTVPKPAAPRPTASTSSTAPITWSEDLTNPSRVRAIRVPCPADQRTRPASWFPISIPKDHPAFEAPLSPVSTLIEFPIRIWREGTKSSNRADLDNQTATWIMIEPKSGFAPMEWQAGQVGSVIVARSDGKDLSMQHFEGVREYCSAILDAFGDGPINQNRWYNKKAYEKWFRNYVGTAYEARKGYEDGVAEFGGTSSRESESWKNVPSPFAS